jgi:hypothetical protein
MVRMMGGNALFGVVLGAAMVGLGLTQHLPLFAAFGVYVGLVSLWRPVDHLRGNDHLDRS